MSKLLTVALSLCWALSANATPTAEQPDRNVEIYNLQGDLGLKGYDPVGYFPEGGSSAQKGDASITTEYGGVVYRFANEDNRETFLENPTKYEPTYGGWCAFAMSEEAYADIDPTLYTINGNRAHFFISRGTKAQFDFQIATREPNADDYWKSESGEDPRL